MRTTNESFFFLFLFFFFASVIDRFFLATRTAMIGDSIRKRQGRPALPPDILLIIS